MIVNGNKVGDKPLTKGQINYLTERLGTVQKEVIRDYENKVGCRVFKGKGNVSIGIVNEENKSISLLFTFFTVNDEKYYEEPNLNTKLRHRVPLGKFEDWKHLKTLLKRSLDTHIKDEYFPEEKMEVVEMTQGEFTKLTGKRGLKVFEINPYNSHERLYRTSFFVTNKVNSIVKISLRGKFKFLAIPSLDVLRNKENMKKVLDIGTRVAAPYGTIVEEDTGNVVMNYRKD